MFSSNTVPIIKLEVAGMKYAIQTALLKHTAEMDEYVQQAVEAYCTDENIMRVVKTATTVALKDAIENAVSNFFKYGNGQTVVQQAIDESLLKWKEQIDDPR